MLRGNLLSKKGMVLLALVLFFGAICFGSTTSTIAGPPCEGDFDCDSDVDGSDARLFKIDFGRSLYLNPCNQPNPCNGDFDCDGDVDGTDARAFKGNFGRSTFKNPCPPCTMGEWCSYP